ncbi:MAG: ROK family protein [Muribaculaceae bacterium]|nr:ROK family protein [Muribaculaceae bacterium]
MYQHDNRIVVTLDAGGTNFVFSAMRGCEFIIDPITYPSNSHDLDQCLATMVKGFDEVMAQLPEAPVAISFAFPGPADYRSGIIGGYLPNFPSFRDGVALGPFLSEHYKLPVYINNDGDLFACGEAAAGALPEINRRVAEAGGTRKYGNLLGYTFGTGLGIGSVINGKPNLGNNVCIETYCLYNRYMPGIIAEEGSSIRAIKRAYAELSGCTDDLTPYDIFLIAEGEREGNPEAAREAFARFGRATGDAFAAAITLTDSLVVVGGGLTGAMKYIKPALLAELRSTLKTMTGEDVNRVQPKVYDLDDEAEFAEFATGEPVMIPVYGTDRMVPYDHVKRTGLIVSKLGASKAISIGAYVYALQSIDAAEDAEA